MMGYRSIEYKPTADKYGRENVKFYLNTGKGPEPFCGNVHPINLAKTPL